MSENWQRNNVSGAEVPEAYRVGHGDFYGRDFIVSPDVLIPRPETEMMVDAVLNLIGKAYLPGVRPAEAKLPQDCRILDVGTGSGCIAVTLALELPEAEVGACDISEKALKIAQKNAERLGARVQSFIISNLLENVKSFPDATPDIIVANLPYVDKNWDWLDKAALAKEPAVALYAEDGGLELIKRLVEQVAERKIQFLILEADPCQHIEIEKFARRYDYELYETRGFVLGLRYQK